MAKAKKVELWRGKAAKSIRDEYPDHPRSHGLTPISTRGGCKVHWETFATRAEANAVSKWAIVEARIRMRMGYDSGYCSPGYVEAVDGGFEVCIL